MAILIVLLVALRGSAYAVLDETTPLPAGEEVLGTAPDASPSLALSPPLQWNGSIQNADPPRYVAPGGSDTSNDCTDSLNPCATVQHAVDQALPGDTIYVAAGTYVSGGAGQVVNLDKTVTLLGGYTTSDWTTANPTANPTILDGGGTAQVVTIAIGTSAVIQGFHIRNGTATNGGGV